MPPARTLAFIVIRSAAIFPLALPIDRLRGRTLIRSEASNPVLGMFLLPRIAPCQARSAPPPASRFDGRIGSNQEVRDFCRT
jgi:hypothetical protein